MDLNLIKDIYKLHIKAFEGLDFNVIRKNNYEITYNKNISDCYSNFISHFDVTNPEELNNIIKQGCETFNTINRNTTIYLIPYMQNLYTNRDKFLSDFELISTEVWQTFTDFDKLDSIESNCNLQVTLELTTDMEAYADAVMKSYQSGEKDDPYGNLDDGYRQGYINYKPLYDDFKNEFYFIKVNDEIIGTTQSVYNNNLYGIYSLAIKTNYRGQGIGKEVIKKQLQMCKNKNINTAYLQTEQYFYPSKMYRKIGFKDLCEVYYYSYKQKER